MSKPNPDPNDIDYGSNFLHAEDLIRDGKWCEVPLVIAGIHAPGEMKAADKRPIDRYVLSFEKTDMLLALNRTNWELIRLLVGSKKRSDWIGTRVVLYPAGSIRFGRDVCTGIRVRVDEDRIPFRVRKHMGIDMTGKPVNESQ